MEAQAQGRTLTIDIDYDPGPSQLRFHESAAKHKGFVGAVRSGKTTAICQEGLRCAFLNPGLSGVMAAPTYPMLRDVTRKTFLEILTTNNIRHQFHKADNQVQLLDTASLIMFRSMSDPDSLRGPTLAWFGADEVTIAPWASYEQLRSRLSDARSVTLEGFCGFTPKGFDKTYKWFTERGHSDRELIYGEPFENAVNLAPGFYEGLRNDLDEETYEQEGRGQVINLLAGRAYKSFTQANNVRTVIYDPRYPLNWSLDFNWSPMCSVIGQEILPQFDRIQPWQFDAQRPDGRPIVHVLDEIALMNADTGIACKAFEEKMQKYRAGGTGTLIVNVTADATGKGHHTSSLKTDLQIIREFFQYHPWLRMVDRIATGNPEVRDRVNTVKAFCKNAAGVTSLFIDPQCEMLIDDLAQVGWPKDAKGNQSTLRLDNSNPMLTHASDALGYWLWKISPLRATVGEMSGSLPI